MTTTFGRSAGAGSRETWDAASAPPNNERLVKFWSMCKTCLEPDMNGELQLAVVCRRGCNHAVSRASDGGARSSKLRMVYAVVPFGPKCQDGRVFHRQA